MVARLQLGTYPQVFVDTANLAGTLVANISAPRTASLTRRRIKTSSMPTIVTGTFDQCLVNGDPGQLTALDFGCVYDATDNVDLGV